MRYLSLLFLYLFFQNYSVFAQRKFEINGIVSKKYDNAKIQFLNTTNDNIKYDYCEVRKCHFKIKGRVVGNKYNFCTLRLIIETTSYEISFFIKSGEMKMRIDSLSKLTNQNKITYLNFPLTNEYCQINNLLKPLENKIYNNVVLVFGAYHKSTKIDSLIADSLLQIIRYDRGQLRTKQFYFVKNYANSYVGFFILKTKMATDFFANADTLLNLFNQLKKEFKHTEEGEWLLKKIKNKLGIRIGQQINNFSFRNNQDEFTGSDSFLGKRPILLCFWASWCKPCIKKIPEIKNIYEAYAGKGLEIISISIDKTSEEWKKAIIKYDLNWLQAIDGSTNYLGKNIASVFDIEAVPQYFLIDKDKKIIYHNIKVKENEELDKLKEILRNIFFEK